ncbi:class I adenylate-forming enzyme family protein [Virgibacillus necropolis]|uniref:Long-chain-fatty-acid--CoA ligase n=1 Tax=Virgibacillus necropolis TaxID=163877 RepID=A0A221MEA3_9BACI|nr:AMP-binding protein [Virgibacillus necropolis]ASN05971.1 Long-chain-fatty-acid--CoA ligase [Virgibacillus necropolis]
MVSTTVRIIDDQGENVKHDGIEIGEIIVKGPSVIDHDSGNNNENEGWLRTGDMGTIDEEGRVKIVDRKKDIVLNDKDAISSIEVESVFTKHPAIREIAIIVRPHKKLGDILHAIVVLQEGHLLTKEELFLYAKENLEEIKCPKEITFMDELPKTPSGKIQKIQLSELV